MGSLAGEAKNPKTRREPIEDALVSCVFFGAPPILLRLETIAKSKLDDMNCQQNCIADLSTNYSKCLKLWLSNPSCDGTSTFLIVMSLRRSFSFRVQLRKRSEFLLASG